MKKHVAEISGLKVFCNYDKAIGIESLKPNPQNPRNHPPKQIELFGKVLKKNGWRRPITVSNRSGLITKGHGVLEGAKFLNVSMVPVEYQDYKSKKEELSDILADNELAKLAEDDDEDIKAIIEELQEDSNWDLELTGMPIMEIESLFDKSDPPSLTLPEDEKSEALKELTQPMDNSKPSGVRMVQLFFSPEQADKFNSLLGQMQNAIGIENLSDAVFDIINRYYNENYLSEISESESRKVSRRKA